MSRMVSAGLPPVRVHPHDFADSDDFAHPPQDEANWSESFLVQAYSPRSQIGFYAHSNRCHWDSLLWSEVVAVYLPGDRFAVAKGFGYGRSTQQVGGGLSFEAPRPFEENVTRYRGAAQLIDGQVLRNGPAPSGMHVGLDVELTQHALGPPFGVGDVRAGNFGHTHYEQHFSCSGQITLDGERFDAEGTGMRDHTWGPRDLSVMGNHFWIHGEFPDGRWLSTMYIARRGGDGALLSFHVVGDGDGLTHASLAGHDALLDAESQVFDPWTVELRIVDEVQEIRGEIIAPMPFSFAGPVEMTLGTDRTPDASHVVYESQARLNWGGQIGYGLCERSVARPRKEQR
jgi:hypothetical protein